MNTHLIFTISIRAFSSCLTDYFYLARIVQQPSRLNKGNTKRVASKCPLQVVARATSCIHPSTLFPLSTLDTLHLTVTGDQP